MAWTDADIIRALAKAGTKGLSKSNIARSVSASRSSRKLTSALTTLKAGGAIRGPFRIGHSSIYFDAQGAPTREQLESRIEDFLQRAGTRVTGLSDLEKAMKGAPKSLLKDALSVLKGEGRVIQLRNARRSPLYVHYDAIIDQLRLERSGERARLPVTPSVTIEDLRRAYLTLKAEQGGISTVKIYDVWKRLKVPKEEVHALLLSEAQTGRVTLHTASTVNFPNEVTEAGIRIDGDSRPYVTFVLREETHD
jgi:hypothetical protein